MRVEPRTHQHSTTVGEICDRFGGEVQTGPFGSQLHSSDYSAAGIPVVMPQDMHDGRVATTRIARVDESHAKRLRQHALRQGDIAFSRRGDVARFAVITEAEEGWLCGTGSIRIRLNCPEIDTGYLRRYLNQPAIGAWLEHNAKGVTMPNLNTTIVRGLPLAYPPLPEQRRIAAILDQADALRAKRREALAELDSLTQSIFIEMFGDPATNPHGWPEVTIADLCEVKGGKRLPKGEDYSATPTPFRYIRVTDIRSGEVDESKLVFLKPEVQRTISRYVVSAGDVIISIAGSIGLIAPVSSSLAGANLTENAAKLVPRNGAPPYDHVFLAKLLQTPFAQDQISSHVGQVTIGKLALFRIERIRLPLPPIDAQRKFAENVRAVARLRHSHLLSIDEVESLFGSLQQRAFAGQLT